MKIRNITILLSAFTLVLSLTAFAGEKNDTKKTEAKTTAAGAKVEKVNPRLGNQTHCPVMGGEIDSSSYTDIQGQRVYHCCPMCTGKLEANPDKYFKAAVEKGIHFENIQKTCPVSGEALEDEVLIGFEGRKVIVCCDKCVKMFKKDPAKYLTALTEASKAEAKAAQKKASADEKNHGHDHNHGH